MNSIEISATLSVKLLPKKVRASYAFSQAQLAFADKIISSSELG